MLTHDCKQFSSSTYIPDKWCALLNCQTCKKALIQYVAEEMMCLINNTIRNQQVFVPNIEETAYSTTTEDMKMVRPLLWTNANEGDLHVWLHSLDSSGQRKLIFYPNTDIYHTGLIAMLQANPETDVIVQLSKSITDEPKFLHLNALTEALSTDPLAAAIPIQIRPQ